MSRQSILDKLTLNHETQIKKTLEDLEAQIISDIAEHKKLLSTQPFSPELLRQKTAITIQLRNDFKKQFQNTFLAESDSLIREYDQLVGEFMKEFGKLDIPDKFKNLTKVDLDTISALKTQTFQGFEEVANTYLTEINTNVYQNVIGGRSFDDMVRDISGKLTGGVDAAGRPMSSHAGQLAHDSIMQFDAQFVKAKASSAGLTHFRYAGTAITTTRDFCQRHIGQVYSEEEIRSIWSGSWTGKSSGDPFVVRGGYRCRHTWNPVDPDWLEKEEKKKEEKPIVASKSTVQNVVISSLLNRGSKTTRQAYDDDFNSQLTDQQKIIVNKFDKPKVIKNGKSGYYKSGSQELSAELNSIDKASFRRKAYALDDKGVKSFVIAHEYGHHLDFITKKDGWWSSTNADFRKAIERDKRKFKGTNNPDLTGKNAEGYYVIDSSELQSFFDKLATKKSFDIYRGNTKIANQPISVLKGDGFGEVSDIVDALTSGRFRKNYKMWGHSESYWRKLGHMEKEIFANLFAIRHNKKAYSLAKEIIPNTVKEFEKRLAVLEKM